MSTNPVEKHREMLKNPCNAAKLQENMEKEREYSKNYRKKQLESPENSENFKKKKIATGLRLHQTQETREGTRIQNKTRIKKGWEWV